MGYDTNFDGSIDIQPALSKELTDYIRQFSNIRHFKRDISKIHELNGGLGLSFCLNGNPGEDGCFYIGNDLKTDLVSVSNDEVLDGLSYWCDFTVKPDGTKILWTQAGKTRCGLEWVTFMINHLIAPFGHVCNGKFECQGDNFDDKWEICVENNEVTRNDLAADVQLCVTGRSVYLIDPDDSSYIVYEGDCVTIMENVLDVFSYIKDNNYNLTMLREDELTLIEDLHIKDKLEINALLEGIEPSVLVDEFSFVEFFNMWKKDGVLTV